MLAAPLVLIAVMTLALSVASVSWAAFGDRTPTTGVILTILVPGVAGVAALLAVRGCFVEVADGTVRDVAAWLTVRRVDQDRIVTARVRTGPWRLYVLDLCDGSTVKLVGASPQQFPARLLPDARERDLEELDVLLGRLDDHAGT